jgi:hypothetical protein
MPNSQIFPQSTYPITGDVQSTPGDPTVRVQGFQKTPVSSTPPQDGQVYVYVADINQWVAADPIVSGPNAPGTTPTANPVQVGGSDDGNLVRELRLDSSGTVVSTNLEKLLMLLISEVRKTNLILMDLSGNDPIGDQDGDFEST